MPAAHPGVLATYRLDQTAGSDRAHRADLKRAFDPPASPSLKSGRIEPARILKMAGRS